MRFLIPSLTAMLLAGLPPAQAQTQPLNDTGITGSGNATNAVAATCDASHPAGQDCHYGRDKAAADGALAKAGASALNNGIANGFDFTKVCNSGQLAGQGTCPADPALGAGNDDWACTKDNVTGLVWEVKVNDSGHLRHMGHTYYWYSTDATTNGGSPGTPGSGSSTSSGAVCAGSATDRCDTEKFVVDVNAAGLCGATDWRMPTIKELHGIADLGRASPASAAIDPVFFPNTPMSSDYWSGTRYIGASGNAWRVDFRSGAAHNNGAEFGLSVRLVRTGP